MEPDENEEKLLRSVALQNARAILLARDRAERNLAEAREALEQSNQRATQILESIADGFFALDCDWRFTYVNRSAQDVLQRLGKSKEDLLGGLIWDEFPDIVGTVVEQRLRKAAHDQTAVNFETFYPPVQAWFEVRVYPSVEGLSIYFHDVTRRKNAEEEVRQQHQWFKVTLSSIGDAVMTTDIHSRITFLNPVAEAMTGWKTSEANGQPLEKVFRIIHEQTREPVDHPVSKALRDATVVGLANHTALISKDGRETAIEDSAAPIRDGSGKMAGAVMVFHDVTERRRAAEALQRSEQFNRSIIESSRDSIAVLDLAGRLLMVARDCRPGDGIPEAGASVHSSWIELWPAPDRDAARAAIQAAAAGGSGTFVGWLPDGAEGRRWWDVLITPILDAQGQPEKLLAVSRDVTERQRTEALRLRLAAVVESSDDSIVSTDLDCIITTWNKGAERMFGYEAREAIGQSVTLIIPPERVDEEPRILARLKRGERVEHYETVRVHQNGTRRHISLTVSPIYDPQGQLIGVSKIARDISDRIRARDALRESEQRFRTVADAAPVLIWESGLDKKCTYFNKAWLDFVGRSLEAELGDGWAENVHPDDLARCLQVYTSAFDRRQPFEMEYRLRHHSGEYRWILDRGVPRFRPDGTFLGYIGGCVDIQDQKRAEEHLERLVADRTATLRESMGELEAFSYSISHDMRAPLRAIQSFAHILSEDCGAQVSEAGKEYIRRIITAARRMDRLIQDVLTYSRVGRTELPMAPIPLEKLLREILESYPDFQVPTARIELEGTFPMVLANEAVLTQCVSNLLNNAIKFVEPGVNPRVRVWAEPGRNGGMAKVCFQDNGLGISPEAHQSIFGIFQRVSNRYDGTGIGLAIVRKGVERMGGAVGLESQLGCGSTFWLELIRA